MSALTVVTAGHVDHGKSTLVRALTGMEPDRLEEERRRGLSIELGFAWARLAPQDDRPVAFVDVPGHEDFIRTMVAGAAAAPCALLVVAADDGWQVQTQEHVDILRVLAVPLVAAAVTRSGLATPEQVDRTVADVTERLDGRVPVVPVDSVSGTHMDALRTCLRNGLLDVPSPANHGMARLWLDRAFTIRGAGTVVTGTLAGGAIDVGMQLTALPLGRQLRVRSLQCLGASTERAAPGDRVAVNLADTSTDEVHGGDVLVGRPTPRPTTEFEALIAVLPGESLANRGAWTLHLGTTNLPVKVRLLEQTVANGPEEVAGRLSTQRPLPLLTGDRFVLRDSGRQRTVAGGEVVDVWPGAMPRGLPARRVRAAGLADVAATPVALRAVPLVEVAGGVSHRVRLLGTSRPAPGVLVEAGQQVVTPPTWQRWTDRVVQHLGGVDAATRTDLLMVLDEAGCPHDAAASVLDSMEETEAVARQRDAYVSPTRREAFELAEHERARALVDVVASQPFAPREIQACMHDAGATPADLRRLLATGELVDCKGVTFAGSALRQAVQVMRDLTHVGGTFTTGQVRDALGTTRKFAIALLEHLDEQGVTHRVGDARRLADDATADEVGGVT